MKGSLIIAFFFLAGIAAGQLDVAWEKVPVQELMQWSLYMLMLFVGLSFGSDPRLKEILGTASPKLLMLPMVTVIGTFAGISLYNVFFHSLASLDAYAIGAGFGYYSLSSILIGKYSGAGVAVIALLANVLREILTLLAAPLIVRFFGPASAIASGGATSMDTTLAVIVKSAGKEYLVISLFNGIVLTVLVPFIISFLYRVF